MLVAFHDSDGLSSVQFILKYFSSNVNRLILLI